jgi:hypothetical protein
MDAGHEMGIASVHTQVAEKRLQSGTLLAVRTSTTSIQRVETTSSRS